MMMGAIAIAVMLIDKRGVWGAMQARGVPAVFTTRRTLENKAESALLNASARTGAGE